VGSGLGGRGGDAVLREQTASLEVAPGAGGMQSGPAEHAVRSIPAMGQLEVIGAVRSGPAGVRAPVLVVGVWQRGRKQRWQYLQPGDRVLGCGRDDECVDSCAPGLEGAGQVIRV